MLIDDGAPDEVAASAEEDVVAAFAQPVKAPAAKAALMRIDIQMRFMVVPSSSNLETHGTERT